MSALVVPGPSVTLPGTGRPEGRRVTRRSLENPDLKCPPKSGQILKVTREHTRKRVGEKEGRTTWQTRFGWAKLFGFPLVFCGGEDLSSRLRREVRLVSVLPSRMESVEEE